MNNPEKTTPSLVQDVITETINLLKNNGSFNDRIIKSLESLAQSGHLSKSKDITAILAEQGDDHENSST